MFVNVNLTCGIGFRFKKKRYLQTGILILTKMEKDISIAKKLTDSDIMTELIKQLKTSAPKLRKALGYSSDATIYRVLYGQNSLSDDLANRIVKQFPEVNYWYLKKGKTPVLLSDKLARNQMNILFADDKAKDVSGGEVDYGLETFQTVKRIESLLERLVIAIENK